MKVNRGDEESRNMLIPRPQAVSAGNKALNSVKTAEQGSPAQKAQTFGEIFSAELKRGDLKLSGHAERRLRERNVTLNQEDMRKIEGAVNRAATKGSRESLLIYGDLALVANVRNKTIVTAMEGKDMQDHVFTNIDSAVFIR